MSKKYGEGLDKVSTSRVSSLLGKTPAFVKEVVDLDASDPAGAAPESEKDLVDSAPAAAATLSGGDPGLREEIEKEGRGESSLPDEGKAQIPAVKYPFFHAGDLVLYPVPKAYDNMAAYNFRLPLSLMKTVGKHSKLVGAKNPSEWVRDAIRYKLSLEQQRLVSLGVDITFSPDEDDL